MKATIKKFMELQNVSFTTPAKIEAGHDVGKTTIYRAVLFAITGKDINGKDFDGCIYPKAATTLEELQVEVSIEQNGITFSRIAKGSEKRVKGSDESTLQRSVTSTYSINFLVVNKSEYDAKIEEVFGNVQLFCNPDYFRNLDKDKKRAIFASLVKIDKTTYFDGIEDKALTNGKLTEQRKQIAAKQANLVEFGNVQQPAQIEVVDYKSQIAELQAKRNAAMPTLTIEQEAVNLAIEAQISQLEKSVFIPENLKVSFSKPNEPELIDLDKLRKEYSLVQISEPDTIVVDSQIATIKSKIENIKSLSLQIENYSENVQNSKCTLCQVCAAPNCQFKKVEFEPLNDLLSKLYSLKPIEFEEKLLQEHESIKIDYLRNFEYQKSEKLELILQKGNAAKIANENAIADFAKLSIQIDAENAEIRTVNAEISNRNNQNAATYQSDKATQIQALKSKLHEKAAFNPFEFDDKIHELAGAMTFQQMDIDNYNQKLGSFKHAQNRISEITVELQEMKSVLIGLERNLIAFEAAEKSYYTDFENKINSEMPENVKISLFKKNLSNDGYSDVFEIEFNGSVYAGNGYTIAFYIFLCNWFQTKFEKSLPIFIDEAIILNENLYCNVKNTVILMRNDEMKTLKITEL